MLTKRIYWLFNAGVAVVICLLIYMHVNHDCNPRHDRHNEEPQLDRTGERLNIELEKLGSVMVQQKSVVEQKDSVVEQKDSVVEKKNSVEEQQNSVVVQKDSGVEQKDSVVEKVKPECLETQASQGNEKLVSLRQYGYACDLSKVDLDSIPDRGVTLTFHTYLDNIDVVCKRKLRAGNLGDGGWEVCDDVDVRPQPPCIVYSFGINNDFSFDDAVSDLYGCHVYSFDPSMGIKAHNRSDKIHFYDLGLYGKTGHTMDRFPKWSMYTLKDLRAMLGHSNIPIDILKIDIEYSEWSALPDILDTGQLDDVRQFYLEYHVIWSLRKDIVLPQLKIFQRLEKLGFKKFHVHKNEKNPREIKGFPVVRTKCYEVHYIKRK